MKRIAFALAATSALALAGCAKKPPAQLPPAPAKTATPAPAPAPAPTPTPTGPAPGTEAHFHQTMDGQDVIYFDTNKYNIDSADAAALRAQAQYLLQYPNVQAQIQGNCDERGTREYNLALGERRAVAAKNYLVSLGVDPSRLTTISYGKERPVALGHNPEAWAKNRRDVTVVIQ